MEYGAGFFAANKFGAAEIVDPRPYLVGSLLVTHRKYPHLGAVIPAMGYWPEQIEDLEQTINAVPCDSVVIATPMDLRRVVRVGKPAAALVYAVEDREAPFLSEEVERLVDAVDGGAADAT
jgi:predicted GTPase